MRALAVIVIAGFALIVSVSGDVPARLPGVALGSTVLLHAERTLALMTVVVAGVTVVARAAQGQLPTELSTSGLKYEPTETQLLRTSIARLQAELDGVKGFIGQIAPVDSDERPASL